MAEFSYAAVLALIKVIERAGIDERWTDFLRVYKISPIDLPLLRPSEMYPAPSGPRRMALLRELGAKGMDDPDVKRFFESLAEAVLRELFPAGENLLAQADEFWRIDEEAAALGDLVALKTRLEEGGYLFTDERRLVAEDTPPPEHEIDKVTGIRIRRPLERDSERTFHECMSADLLCAAVFIDIDDFGQFNKTHGAHVGDEVLRLVAGAVDAICRLRGGVVGRYGGEEIVTTMRNLNEDEAAALGERIRAEVTRLSVTDKGLTVTVSVGVASTTKGALADLWQAANTAERQAKDQGKNRVVRFSQCKGTA